MNTKDMTQGNELKLIFLFSLPLMLGNVFQNLYTVCDSAIVSRTLGLECMGAIGCADWLNWMGLSMVTGLAQGFSIPLSHAFGMKDTKQIQKTISAMIGSCITGALFMMGFMVFLLKPVLTLLNTPQELMPLSMSYSIVINLGLCITMFYNALACILRAFGNSKIPLQAMIFASISNLILDVVFIVKFHMGIQGAAYATLLAQFMAGIYCLIPILKLKEYLPTSICKEFSYYKHQFSLGIPMALQNTLISIGGMMLTRAVNSYGTYFLAGFTAMNKLYGTVEISAISYGYAMVTYTGQNYGAKRYDRIRSGVRKTVILSVGTAIVLAMLITLGSHSFISLFIDQNEIGANLALDYGLHFLRWITLPLPILYVLHIYRSTLQGLNDGMIPMLSGLLELIARVVCSLVFPILFGMEGLYFVEVMAWIAADVLLIPAYYIHQSKWHN